MALENAITLAIAVVGAVLGIINTWYQFLSDRVLLRVQPKAAILLPNGSLLRAKFDSIFEMSRDIVLCIEVVNLSRFPVTVSEVGLVQNKISDKERMTLTMPIVFDDGPWPRRLESRTSVTVYFHAKLAFEKGIVKARKAYARTACGKAFYGKSPALKQYVEEAGKVQNEM